ncbi:MAG: MFS transporter [Actinomycetia bacterium]|nr:MFS transporter [Actinomycetes bacterium]
MRQQNWKDRTYRFLIAQAISLLGSSIVQFAIIWHITLETSSGTMMTYAVICSFAPQIIVSLFAGVLLDRFNRKAIIMIADSVIALTTLALFFILGMNPGNLTWLFIALAIRSIGTGIQSPAVNAVIPQLAPEEMLMRINGYFVSLGSLIAFLSPAAAALVLGLAGFRAALLVDVVTAIIGVGITATILFPALQHTDKEAISEIQGIKDGFRYLRTHPLLKRLFIFEAMALFLFSPVFMLALISERSFGGEYWRLASMESAYGLGAIIGGIFIGWWGGFSNRMSTVLLAGGCLGILMISLGFLPFWPFITVLFVWGLFNPSYEASLITMIQERVEPDMHGRTFGFLQIVIASSLPLGMILFGPLADVISIEQIFIINGSLVAALVVFARYVMKLEQV